MSKRAIVSSWTLLIVLLTAGAAQGLSGKNTIFSNDISEGEVHSSDIKNGTIRGKDVKNNSLTAKDIDESTLDIGLMGGAIGPVGPKGDTGATGPAGPKGDTATGVMGKEVVPSLDVIVAPGQVEKLDLECPTGKVVTGGGYLAGFTAGADIDYLVIDSRPSTTIEAWVFRARNDGPNDQLFNVFAVCVNGP